MGFISTMRDLIRELRTELQEAKASVSRAHAKKLGDKLGVDWKKVPLDQLKKGIEIEKEHGRGPHSIIKKDGIKYAKIALAHIDEIPDYYTRLNKMEKGASK